MLKLTKSEVNLLFEALNEYEISLKENRDTFSEEESDYKAYTRDMRILKNAGIKLYNYLKEIES